MKSAENYTHTHTHTHTQIVLVGLICSIFNFGAYADTIPNLTIAIQNARNACSGISDSMSNLKKMAGINTALTGVGTATGAVALGAGVLKKMEDKAIENWERQLEKIIEDQKNTGVVYRRITPDDEKKLFEEYERSDVSLENNIAKGTQISKTLGNIRTGTLAGTAITDTAGAIIAAKNRVGDELTSRIDACIGAIDALQQERLRARAESTATETELAAADKVINGCDEWKNVDLSKIDKRATGAAISSGTGAALAVVGTATSAAANSDSVRDDSNENKEKSLNTASNVLAGGASAASLVATVFNATQIKAIKKAAAAADKCEEALK